MRSAKIFGEKITNLELLHTGLTPYLETMPYLVPLHTELGTLLGDVKSLDLQQETARGQAREFSRKRQETSRKADDLRRRIASHLRGSLGFTSEQLMQFGINPRPTGEALRRRRKKKEEPAVVKAEESAETAS